MEFTVHSTERVQNWTESARVWIHTIWNARMEDAIYEINSRLPESLAADSSRRFCWVGIDFRRWGARKVGEEADDRSGAVDLHGMVEAVSAAHSGAGDCGNDVGI